MKIGLRIPGAAGEMSWADFCGWCKENGFEAIDVGAITAELAETVGDAGLTIGSADLPGVRDLLSVDSAKQEAEDASLGRAKNYEIWKETVPPIAEFAASKGVGIAVEGWPGGGPAYPALGCTPEMWREMFSECPDGLGLNYDPSHLVRISIDYLRALNEFADKVLHVHAKDTVFDQEALYLHGNLGPIFHSPRGFGEDWWRYCIPGDGVIDWLKVVQRLEDEGFDGIVSVELEDYRYWEDWEAQADGLKRSQSFLSNIVR